MLSVVARTVSGGCLDGAQYQPDEIRTDPPPSIAFAPALSTRGVAVVVQWLSLANDLAE
jgi:hypothetical protein